MSYATIEFVIDRPLATIRLNRPERMNAVIEEMYSEIQDALRRSTEDSEIRCLILTGSVLRREGEEKQAFCAGADLKRHAAGDRGEAERRRYIELAHDTTRMMMQFPKPIIAAVNGPARGAGAELALACDFVLMAEEATLGLPEIGLGTFVGGGITHMLPRLVGLQQAKLLVYTGKVLDGKKAAELGLALECCPLSELHERASILAVELAEKAPISMALAKKYLHISPRKKIEKVLRMEAEAILECMESEDWREGVRAFGEKRKPKFNGR